MLYLAYGSNLNVRQMATRCPHSKTKGKFNLPNYKLVFRSVADIIKSKGDYVPVGVWDIDIKDEDALDRYEGYPHLYTKKYLTIKTNGTRKLCMFYIMNDDSYLYQPSNSYYKTIEEGYKNFKLNLDYLKQAKTESIQKSDDLHYSLFNSLI